MTKKNSENSVCVVIPAYNEAAAIGDVVHGITKTLSASNYIFEVIVVDDGSKDETASIAKKNGARVIRHILNSGSGSATATGLSYADQRGFFMAATMDADGQHAPKDILKGLSLLEKQQIDLLIGSRLINSRGMSRVKILGNRGLSFITFLLFGVNSTDSQSGMRIFSRRALKQLRWRTSGYEFCSEMLWRAKQIGLAMNEYPIKAIYTEYSKTKGQNNWNAFNIIRVLIRRRLTELFQ